MTDTLDLALELISLGWKIFPVDAIKKHPLLENGHLGASDEPEVVATWWSGEFASAGIGVATGPSGITVADVDIKNSKNGFDSVEEAFYDLPDTFSYNTPNGGQHLIYRAPEDKTLNGNADYRGLSGLDRRAGSSYIVFHGRRAPKLEELNRAPEWFCDESTKHTTALYGGGVQEWLDEYGQGEPNEKTLGAIERIPDGDISHSTMVEDQFNMIRLGAEGSPGVATALNMLRDAWLNRDPRLHSTPQSEWEWKFDEALASGIAKAGAADELIANLPAYLDALQKLPHDFDLDDLQSVAKPKKHYFQMIKALCSYGLDSEVVASLIWHSRTTKDHAREWGIEYLFAEIDKAKNVPADDKAEEYDDNDIIDQSEFEDYPLLTETERDQLCEYTSFIDRYSLLASDLFPKVNLPYHRLSGLTTLAMAFGCFAFVPMTPTKKLPLNIFGIGLGKSGTGKSDSVTLTRDIWKDFFGADVGYNSGTMVSSDALREVLLERDGKPTLFASDEAAGVLLKMLDPRGYQANLVDEITSYFDGWVDPIQKKSAKELSGRSAQTAFSMRLLGTPDRVTSMLTEDQFESGFLARPIWYVGDSANMEDSEDNEPQVDEFVAEEEFNPAVRSVAVDLLVSRGAIGTKKHYPVLASREALKRIGRARDSMAHLANNHPREAILGPSVRRLGDNIRKVSALLALAEGSTRIETWHVLKTLEFAEEWLKNLMWIAERVVSSRFERECDEIWLYLSNAGGILSKARLARAHKRYELRDYLARIGSLDAQGRIKESSDGKNWEIRK